MEIRLLICLTILCMGINGQQLYSSNSDERLNAIEYELLKTKDDLRVTTDRLSITELQNQEQKSISRELELKFKNVIFILESNNLELNDRLKLTESKLIQTNDKLKATEEELVNTREELKSTNSHLSVVETELKTTNAKINTISSKCATTVTKKKEHVASPDKQIFSEYNDAVANKNNIYDRQLMNPNSEQPKSKIIKSHKGKRVDELPLGSMVAFHAQMGQRGATNLTPGQTIKFETVKQNFGNGYDPKLGEFTSPKYGLYLFTFTILSNPNKRVDTMLVVNGSTIAYSLSAGTPSFHNSGSKSVIVPLHAGDKVWLEFSSGDSTIVGGQWSTLTGFIISAT